MNEIKTIDDYFKECGHMHIKKASNLLEPLHTPNVDPLPDFEGMERRPFEAQAHVIASCIKMLDETRRGIIAAQMGTGKSLMGALIVHYHAMRSVRKGGCNGKYRAVVLCPDHLITKWRDELHATIPGVKVTIFDEAGKGCKQLVVDMNRMYGELRQGNGRWRKPEGPEWYVLGRDQAKLMPGRAAMGKLSSQLRKVHYKDEENVMQVMDVRTYLCPKCGHPLMATHENPADPSKGSKLYRCEGKYGVEIPAEDRRTTGLDRWPAALYREGRWQRPLAKYDPGQVVEMDGRKWRVTACNEPLWQFTRKPKRWPPALFMANKMRGAFPYLIADEIHEQKAKGTAQANACGKLIANSRYTLALTGTLIGGYARDLFYLLMRTGAGPLVDEGFEWKSAMDFTRAYGRIERVVTTRTSPEGETSISKGTRSMRKGEEESTTERAAPGIMPALFGRHLISKAVFLSLEDMAANLPRIREYVGGLPAEDFDAEDKAFWVECRVPMSDMQREEYKRIEGTLTEKCRELLTHGSMKLFSSLLHTTLEWIDRPWDWRAPTEKPEHMACGYWEKPRNRDPSNWVGVVQPRDFPQDVVYPKEQALLDIVEKEVDAGRQVWIYVQMSGKKDVQVRLKALLDERGYTSMILRSQAVNPRKRLAWIEKHGPNVNVIISHPQLVQTGVDFFKRNPGGGYSHNFTTIVFYETGYSLFTLRQAAARHWRIGQMLGCRVYYLHYAGTMQARAMTLMARKMAAATQLDGDLSVEGLMSMADDQSSAMALARAIGENIDDADINRNWAKVGQTLAPLEAAHRALNQALAEVGLASIEENPLDGLDSLLGSSGDEESDILNMETALIAQCLLDNDPRITRKAMAGLLDDYFGMDVEDMAALFAAN